jgi:hypothetical protein
MSFKIGDKVLIANLDTEYATMIEEKICSLTQKPIWWVEVKLLNRKQLIYGAFFKDTLNNVGN